MSEQIFSRKQSFGTPGRVALDTFDHVGQFAKFRLGNRYAFLKSGSGVMSHSSGLSILWNERGKVQECSCGLKKQVFCPRSFINGELNEPRRIRKRHLKLKWRCFKLCRAYYTSLNSSSLGNLFWSWILKGFIEGREKKKKIVVFCSRLPPQNIRLGIFTL